ncbi:MAG: ATP-binding protein, partial [Planctomyces sp.]
MSSNITQHHQDIIRQQLKGLEQPRDSLPYSPMFETLRSDFEQRGQIRVPPQKYWKLLSSIDKRGGLATVGRRKRIAGARRATKDEQLEILRLLPDGIGSRDDLPYTKRFDELHRRFIQLTGSEFTKYEFWRAVSTVGKRSQKPRPLFESAPAGSLPVDTVRFLERLNPWWRGLPRIETPDMRRWAYDEVLKRFDANIAPVVAMRGPRQVGKTTIQQQVIERFLLLEQVPPQQILRVQFDEAPALGQLENPVESIVRWFEDQILGESLNAAAQSGKKVYLFLDEVQNLKDWSEQIKALVDSSKVQILLTGSSALRIGQGRDSLAGRLSSIELGPMRLTEIARLRGFPQLRPFSTVDAVDRWTEKEFWLDLIDYGKRHAEPLNQAFKVFSTYGGYPVCHKSAGIDLASLARQMVEAVVERTIAHEMVPGVSEDVVRGVFQLLCRYAGERVKPKRLVEELSQRTGSGVSEKQVHAAVAYLENTMLVRLLKPLEISRKRQPSGPTICLCDHFIRYALLREQIPLVPSRLRKTTETVATQAGHLMEGIVGSFFAGTEGVNASFFPAREQEPEIDVVL